jgi:uncharacterized membrane protein
MAEATRHVPKLRLDALTDGVFAVAMTLLVIDLKLPENFRPKSMQEFLHGLAELETQFIVYMVSFLVLGVRWTSLAKFSGSHEMLDDRYVRWSLWHLFLITCIPFSTMVVGRYGAFPPAIWIYAANTILSGLVALRLVTLAAPHLDADERLDRRMGLAMLIGVSLLVIAASFYTPQYALLLYLLNMGTPLLRRVWPTGKSDDVKA